MMKSKKALILALFFPIFALAVLTAYKKYVVTFGTVVILPISGYDPRDLLSGHYLIYQIDYGVEGICETATAGQDGYVCLEPKAFSFLTPPNCAQLIRGVCRNNRFEAGIERFYVPEDKAKELEQQITAKSASIVLSLTSDGQTQVKDLLVEGKSWRELLK